MLIFQELVASQNLGMAELDSLDKKVDLQLGEETTKAERLFLLQNQIPVQELEKILADSSKYFLSELTKMNNDRQEILANLKAKNSPATTEDFLKELQRPVRGKTELENFVKSLDTPSRDIVELRSRIGQYCECPYIIRGEWLDYSNAVKRNLNQYQYDQFTKQRKEFDELLKNQPPQTAPAN
jgi:hypothetical protein